MRTGVILTSYNRPRLVQDAIASVDEQTDQDWRCWIMDDGSDGETRCAIQRVLRRACNPERFFVWWGAERSVAERQAHLPYSWTINIALSAMLPLGVRYFCSLPDDDYFYPESIAARTDYLDAYPDVPVVYGRMRAQLCGVDWEHYAAPQGGRECIYPTGTRCVDGARAWWEEPSGKRIDEGYWQAEPLRYGHPHAVDHSQVMWRRECCNGDWPLLDADPLFPRWRFWSENNNDCGDATFFEELALRGYLFHSVNAWVTTKRYHKHGDGCLQRGELRRE